MFARRDVLCALALSSAAVPLNFVGQAVAASGKRSRRSQIEAWMDRWMSGEKALGGAMRVSRFRDPIYFLLAPVSWSPNLDQPHYKPVEVPTGFVTDFASIPTIFYSFLRPDGEYAYAAIVHDYLYWTQSRTREESDDILKLAMKDLKVNNSTIAKIFGAVRLFGGQAWDENAKLKNKGEKRILVKFPDDPATLWGDWKKRSDVFASLVGRGDA